MKLDIENMTAVELPTRMRLKFWLGRTLEVLMAEGDWTRVDKSRQPNNGYAKAFGQRVVDSGRIELAFVDAQEIRKLNKQFRKVDQATDVLSFSFLGQGIFPGEDLVGQIFIEPEIARRQAEEHGVSCKEEIEFLFVHALLHVFGFDHEQETDFKQMYDLQAQIMPGPRWAPFVDQIARESFGRGLSAMSHEQ